MQTLLRSALAISAMGIAVGLLASCGGGGGGGGGGGSSTPVFSAAITGTSRIVANTRYDYSATAANGTATNFAWDWGDTTANPTTNGSATKVWYQPRNSTTTLTVTGSAGALATSTQAYTVISHPVMTKAEHACAIRADNSVACWGNNDYGQLGDGTQIGRTTPVAVKGLTNAIGLTGNDKESCALLGTLTANVAGGSVVCWGAIDVQGAPLANNINFAPTPVAGLTNVVSLASGSFHHCALKADGTVWCWGYQASRSVFGNGPVLDPTLLTLAPVQVAGITDATVLASGNDHVCIIRANKTVKCWGWNDYGQTGSTALTQNGLQPVTDTPTPFAVPGVTNAVSLSLGAATSCAVLANGGMQCWGDNDRGQNASGTAIGVLGTQLVHFKPTPLTTPITNVAAGAQGFPACALKTNGSVTCWGDAQPVNSMSHPSALEATITQLGTDNAYVSSGAFTCVLKIDGRLFCRGVNNAGQLGDGSGLDSPVAFVQVVMADVGAGNIKLASKAISVGGRHVCAIKSNGDPVCWGENQVGQLGNTVAGSSDLPVNVNLAGGVTAISAGERHTCAIKTNSDVVCWGANDYGQLGNASNINSFAPVVVSIPGGVVSISSGINHTCAVKVGGSVVCWGINYASQLGNGSTNDSNVPVPANVSGGVTSVSAGELHTCAIKLNGEVVCWGDGSFGQFGNGTTNSPFTSINTSLLAGVTSLSSGIFNSCAIDAAANVACWGNGDYGQLGNGLNTSSNVPVRVSNLTNVNAIASGRIHGCSLKIGGIVDCWGNNYSGQLGNSTNASASTPSNVNLTGLVTAISAGGGATCAIKLNGDVYCWGTYIQLGNGSQSDSNVPVKVVGLTSLISNPLLFWK